MIVSPKIGNTFSETWSYYDTNSPIERLIYRGSIMTFHNMIPSFLHPKKSTYTGFTPKYNHIYKKGGRAVLMIGFAR